MNDLLHHRFPGMTGTVYVANYSWYFTPMWELAKRTLPQRALRIVTFVNESELRDCVPEEFLPKGKSTPESSSAKSEISGALQSMNTIIDQTTHYNAMPTVHKSH